MSLSHSLAQICLDKNRTTFQAEYGIAVIDGHEEKIGNFRIEPPGLFRGRGEHPKQVGVCFKDEPFPAIFIFVLSDNTE